MPSILIHTAGEHTGVFKEHTEVRMLPYYAATFAATYCWRFNPAPAWTYAGRALAEVVSALPAGAMSSQQQRVSRTGEHA